MTISLTPTFSDIPDDGPIPLGTLAYLRGELRNLFHELVLVEFVRQKESGSLHGAKLARRTGKDAAALTRLLGGPGNWTLDTVSDLLAGMGKRIVEVRLGDLVDRSSASVDQLPLADHRATEAPTGGIAQSPTAAQTVDSFRHARASFPEAKIGQDIRQTYSGVLSLRKAA